ncbi:replication endonuclease [Porticoccus hydrocarbonoclasticus]|uniref:replication endonuclease n=1 Tax=Porticoccus hydrocarbonoclasticus TaxID=1073414 RepID=UPI00069246A0|nr:replication endonuclease [Porticoccus hydrocarbonoclasticus]
MTTSFVLKENEVWLSKLLTRARTFGPKLKCWHTRELAKGTPLRDANTRVRHVVDRLWVEDFHFAADDQEIRDLAESFAKRYCRAAINSSFDIKRMIATFEERYGFSLPSNTDIPRISCAKFWRRQLRNVAAQRVEQLNRELGFTRRGVASYVSDWGFKSWLAKDRRNRRLLEDMEAENDFGQSYNLAELADLGISNPVNKRNELMVRLDGFENYAEQNSEAAWVAMFYTWTCPSKYHAITKGKANSKYNGATPVEAQAWFNGQWQKTRAALIRAGVPLYGFRVAEPHRDGTPHWHMLFFVPKARRKALTDILRRFIMAEDGHEPGARKHRFKAEVIDPRKGRATAYLAKYISKNIDGHGLDADDEGEDHSAITALRVRAWSSIWNIRQFQQIGGPPVTVYRECRKTARNLDILTGAPTPEVMEIIEAADKGDWSHFTAKMGGAVCKRLRRPLQLAYLVKEKLGQYGDTIKKVFGLWSHDQPKAISYPKPEWTIRRKGSSINSIGGCLEAQAPPALALEFCQ